MPTLDEIEDSSLNTECRGNIYRSIFSNFAGVGTIPDVPPIPKKLDVLNRIQA